MPFSGESRGGWYFFPPNEQLLALKSLFVTLLSPDQHCWKTDLQKPAM